jgi:hypothetical protein
MLDFNHRPKFHEQVGALIDEALAQERAGGDRRALEPRPPDEQARRARARGDARAGERREEAEAGARRRRARAAGRRLRAEVVERREDERRARQLLGLVKLWRHLPGMR